MSAGDYRGVGPPEVGVTESYELPNVGTKNQTCFLWKNSMCS